MIKTVLIIALLSVSVMAQDIYATFNVKANKEANLALSASGLVAKIYVDIGDNVKKGDTLLELDNEELHSSIVLAQKQIDLAKLNLRFAKKSFERYDKVKDVLDEDKYDNYVSAYERAKISLSSAKANLAYKQTLLNKTRLKAPFSGVISAKKVELGDGVSAATMSTLFTLITPERQKLVVLVDEKYWEKIKLEQEFSYSIDGSKESFTTNVSKIYPAINASRRAITLEMPAKDLKIGLFGHGILKVN